MRGIDLVNFIEENHLQFLEVNTMWQECLVWDYWLDETHKHEIEYNWNYDGTQEIVEYAWDEYGNEIVRKEITKEEAEELRGRCAIEQVNKVNGIVIDSMMHTLTKKEN